jgi:hypothetical protein
MRCIERSRVKRISEDSTLTIKCGTVVGRSLLLIVPRMSYGADHYLKEVHVMK